MEESSFVHQNKETSTSKEVSRMGNDTLKFHVFSISAEAQRCFGSAIVDSEKERWAM